MSYRTGPNAFLRLLLLLVTRAKSCFIRGFFRTPPRRRRRRTRTSTVTAIATGERANESEGNSVNDKPGSIQALGLEDIGVDADELSRFEPLALTRKPHFPTAASFLGKFAPHVRFRSFIFAHLPALFLRRLWVTEILAL